MKKSIKLWNSLMEKLEITTSMTSHIKYYKTLVNWLKENKQFIGEDILKRNCIDILMNLDFKIYINEGEPDLPFLENELNRLKTLSPSSVDSVIMIIKQLLWDMVTIRYNGECSNCLCVDLRIVLARYKDFEKEQIVVSCEQCGFITHPGGEPLFEGSLDFIPANQFDLKRYGYLGEKIN